MEIYQNTEPSLMNFNLNKLDNTYNYSDRQVSFRCEFNDPFNNDNRQENDIFRAKNIGIIYQQDNLLSDFTALENVYLACLSAGYDKEIAVKKAKNILYKII